MKSKAIVLSAFIFLSLSTSAYAYRQVIDLGAGTAYSINDSGQVVGESDGRAFLYNPAGGGTKIDLGTLGGSQSVAYSINNSGKIVGRAADSYNNFYSTLFDFTGGGNNTNISNQGFNPFVSGKIYSTASTINNNGYAVGQHTLGSMPDSSKHGVVIDAKFPFHPGLTVYDLGTLGGSNSYAYSINNNTNIVGWAESGESVPSGYPKHSYATLFDAPTGQNNINLGTIGGDFSAAYSINDSDLIVGQADYSTTYQEFPFGIIYTHSMYHATIFDSTGNGDNIDLGSLGESFYSVAWSVNGLGDIVGWAGSPGTKYATLFDSTGNGNNIDLNTLIDSDWVLKEARCINNNGWIVGTGINPSGDTHAFLLTPEPTTMLLLGLGAAVLRKRK